MSVIEYRVRDASIFSGEVVPVAERIESLKRRHADAKNPDGWVTPEEVLQDARSSDSPLHPYFTWDTTAAAHKQNLQEARLLIRCYEVRVIHPDQAPIVISPANVQIRRPEQKAAYVSSAFAMSEEDTRGQVLADALGMIAGAQKRLSSLQGISPKIIKLIEQTKALIEAEKARNAPKAEKKKRPPEVGAQDGVAP